MSKLNLRIMSFSYRKGLPEDPTGNGGGFTFDCRGLTNPGRLPEYRTLTGKDPDVIHFLQSLGEADRFVNNTLRLIEQSIDAYLEKGFVNLQICFGCTGGQHRSVYCAEKLTSAIRSMERVSVHVTHREFPNL